MNAIITEHCLDFEAAPWELANCFDDGIPWQRFRVGTCGGVFGSKQTALIILGIINEVPGNGHFKDVLQWFYYSCIQYKLNLEILEFNNKRFKAHLIKKHGFHEIGRNDLIKYHHEINN